MLRGFIAIITALVSLMPVEASIWDVSEVYSGWGGIGDSSLVLDASGTPHVSYSADAGLYHAVKVLGGWDSEYVASVGYSGGWSSIAISPAGQPAIAFIDCSNESGNYLKYAYKSGGTWLTETVDSVGWLPEHVCLAYNLAGQPCIAYCKSVGVDPIYTYVCFARRVSAGNWSIQNIAEIGFATAPSMVIDGTDTARVTFVDSNTGGVRCASKAGIGPWTLHTIDGNQTSPAIGYTSIALQPNGAPAVAYFTGLPGSNVLTLKLACWQGGTSWTHEVAASILNEGTYHCSVAVRRGPVPLIAYYDTTASCLKCAWRSGSNWNTEVIDLATLAGFRPSLKLDSLGNAHIAYFDNLNFNVRYAWSPTPIQDAKLLADGEMVQISAVAASSGSGELNPRIYVQDFERTCGIQLYFTQQVPNVTRGSVLDVRGELTTVDGERAIINPSVEEIGIPVVLRPLAVTNRYLGGGDFRYQPGPPARGQRGVTGATGLNNIGLLVTIWGAYTYIDSSTFTVDDGSGVTVKCVTPPGVSINPNWRYVCVTGISSCELVGQELHRLMRVRASSDIVVLQ